MTRYLSWFSCGAASAVASKLAIEKYGDKCEVLYCDTFTYEHPDNLRFFNDVQEWLGQEIKIIRSNKYKDIYDVFKTGYLVGVYGAMCTRELKTKVRQAYQRDDDVHIFGLTADEENRIIIFEENNSDLKYEWILQDEKINKNHCYARVKRAGIELPEMYKLGYGHNNCVGCVKGQAGYWNKIRIDFPEAFEKMAKEERRLDVAINKSYAKKIRLICGAVLANPKRERIRVFLDELHPESGRGVKEPDIECGVICTIEPDNPIKQQRECQLELF